MKKMKEYNIHNLNDGFRIRDKFTINMQIVKETEKAIMIISQAKRGEVTYGTTEPKRGKWIPKSICKIITLKNGAKLLAVESWKGNMHCYSELIKVSENELNVDYFENFFNKELKRLNDYKEISLKRMRFTDEELIEKIKFVDAIIEMVKKFIG